MIFIFLFILSFILISSAIFYGIGPNQTPKKVLNLIVESLPKDVKVIYDLGSGFGFTSYYIAFKRSNAVVIGIEGSLIPFLVSKVFCLFQKNLKIYWKDFRNVSLEDADVVYCYLYRKAMKNLSDKFYKELKHNALVISYTFSIRKKEEKVYDLGGFYQNKLYCYKYVKECI